MSNDKKRDMKKGFISFVKAEKIGNCPCCDESVHTDQLFVREDEVVYHYSCYNRKVADENDKQ